MLLGIQGEPIVDVVKRRQRGDKGKARVVSSARVQLGDLEGNSSATHKINVVNYQRKVKERFRTF